MLYLETLAHPRGSIMCKDIVFKALFESEQLFELELGLSRC